MTRNLDLATTAATAPTRNETLRPRRVSRAANGAARLTIYLDDDANEKLRHLAHELRVPVQELIRHALSELFLAKGLPPSAPFKDRRAKP